MRVSPSRIAMARRVVLQSVGAHNRAVTTEAVHRAMHAEGMTDRRLRGRAIERVWDAFEAVEA